MSGNSAALFHYSEIAQTPFALGAMAIGSVATVSRTSVPVGHIGLQNGGGAIMDMGPKYYPTPLSGGDRKAPTKELARARAVTTILAPHSTERRAAMPSTPATRGWRSSARAARHRARKRRVLKFTDTGRDLVA
ncbi:hypothetical protein [Bradyrhizobium sp. AUGA SZCCT0124]|uniref:hypothetical protein n=1 Tax=unclassified Bradyrhizobium TaxID=2631580 RepID=UPI001BAA258F|nr:hypothetical protein [Bradyrhizobium sp. AUGA SZCCT0124]MBR1315446.1 hypothetical protein [Bradyrhizobium sp. AUGA SZCCT0051]MBR1338492.1 hypothetical protein [Bradyrhizobium sp. AUGA SZCCT0105]MBR1356147.1 hypothetical protein [Bradyrhizobium sp. AUGA SZCCT0045]